MTLLAGQTHTLIDVATRLAPDGSPAVIANRLSQNMPILEDIPWDEGNLITGNRTTVRVSEPEVEFRRINAGVAPSKSTAAAVDEGAAELVGESEVDRTLAILSGNPAAYRMGEAEPFFEAMRKRMVRTLFYGNASIDNKEFTGLTPRYNSLSGFTGDQIIDGGGTGEDNFSIWLVNWGEGRLKGLYPKGTTAGLMHMDTTANKGEGPDGHPIGDYLYDAQGKRYLGYRDHYQWNCGLTVQDYRYAVRIANLDASLLSDDATTGAKLTNLMIEALETIEAPEGAVFYVNRRIMTKLRQQIEAKKGAFLSWGEAAGKRVVSFGEVPVKRVDALNTYEARVV